MVRGQWGNLASKFLYSFWKDIMGFFNDHRESGSRFNVSSEARCFLQYIVPITILGR